MKESRGKVICISGIDTDIGKSFAVGLLARYLLQAGYSVITQKICQTGCLGIAEDILTHRKLMGIELTEDDTSGLTCPYVFSKPCSPHLAAKIEGRAIECDTIERATEELAAKYDYVLLEGAGGLMVPLQEDLLYVDYLSLYQYRHVLVSSCRLGSINHTLLSLESYYSRKLDLRGIVYNCCNVDDEIIAQDSKMIFVNRLQHYNYPDAVVEMLDEESNTNTAEIFTPLIKTLTER